MRAAILVFIVSACLLIYSGMVTLLCSGTDAQGNTMFARKTGQTVLIADFVNHYNAGILSRTCLSQHIAIYDPAVQAASEQKIIDPVKPDLPFFLQYPPYFFALAMPLSFFSMPVAFAIWSVVSILALSFCLFYLLNQTSFDKAGRWLAFFAVLMSYPTWLSFTQGQTSIYNYTAIILSLALLQNNKALPAGLTASLVAVKLQYAPVIGLLGLILGRLKFCAGFATGLIALVSYAVLVLGVDNILAFPKALLMGETSKHVSGVSPETMQNVRGYLTLIFHGNFTHEVNIVSAVISLAGMAVIARMWWDYSRILKAASHVSPDFLASSAGTAAGADSAVCQPPINAGEATSFRFFTALTFPIMMLTSLHCHVYDYVMMSAPCIWLWDLSAKNPRLPGSQLLRIVIAIFPIGSWFAAKFRDQLNSFYIQPDTLWAIALLIAATQFYRSWRNQPE